jgi:hypothetical protein
VKCSIEQPAQACRDRIGASFVVAGTCRSLAAKATFVLEDVMAEFMGKDVAQRETLQRIGWPRDDTFFAEICSRLVKTCSLLLRKCVRKSPRRHRLVVQANMTRSDKLTELEASACRRTRDQFNRFEAVVDLLAEDRERLANIRRRGWMVPPGTRTPCTDSGKRRASRGANSPRITAKAVGHV